MMTSRKIGCRARYGYCADGSRGARCWEVVKGLVQVVARTISAPREEWVTVRIKSNCLFAGAVELGVDVADIDTLPYPK